MCDASEKERSSEEVSQGEIFSNSVSSCKQEDNDSLKSDAVNLDSPHHNDEIYSSLMEPVDCTYVFEHNQSDIYQEEQDNLGKSLLHPQYYVSPKIRDDYYSDPPANASYFGFPDEEDHTFGFWGAQL